MSPSELQLCRLWKVQCLDEMQGMCTLWIWAAVLLEDTKGPPSIECDA